MTCLATDVICLTALTDSGSLVADVGLLSLAVVGYYVVMILCMRG